MSHFYGQLHGRGATSVKAGDKAGGLTALAASWHGAIQVELRHNQARGKDQFRVWQVRWQGAGIHQLLIDWSDFGEKPNFAIDS